MNDNKKRGELSALRILATLSVVCLHTGSALSDNGLSYSLSVDQQFFFESIRNLMLWGVPIFYMITGTLLLDGKRTVTIKKNFDYILRAVEALLVFGIPFAMMEILFVNREISIAWVLSAILYVMEGKSWAHLWYLYSIIGIYLILPLLRCFSECCERKTKRYILVVLFMFTSCLPAIEYVFKMDIAFDIPMNSAVFYVLLGKYLDDYPDDISFDRKTSILLLTIASVVIVFVTRFALGNSSVLLSNSNPLISLMAVVIFSQVRKWKFGTVSQTLWQFDRLCFGVYLIHPLVINSLYKVLSITPVEFQYYHIVTLGFFCIFTAVSFALSYGMCSIKPLRKILS